MPTEKGRYSLLDRLKEVRSEPELVDDDRPVLEVLRESPPDDLESNQMRFELIQWGGPRGCPAIPLAGLNQAGGEAWSEWLMGADREDLEIALAATETMDIPELPMPDV